MRYVQRLFTPRIVVVILMLIAFTLTPVIANNLVFSTQPTDSRLFGLIFAPVGCFAMVILNRTLKGVGKSLVIPIALQRAIVSSFTGLLVIRSMSVVLYFCWRYLKAR